MALISCLQKHTTGGMQWKDDGGVSSERSAAATRESGEPRVLLVPVDAGAKLFRLQIQTLEPPLVLLNLPVGLSGRHSGD